MLAPCARCMHRRFSWWFERKWLLCCERANDRNEVRQWKGRSIGNKWSAVHHSQVDELGTLPSWRSVKWENAIIWKRPLPMGRFTRCANVPCFKGKFYMKEQCCLSIENSNLFMALPWKTNRTSSVGTLAGWKNIRAMELITRSHWHQFQSPLSRAIVAVHEQNRAHKQNIANPLPSHHSPH